jgi:hypothetical protein
MLNSKRDAATKRTAVFSLALRRDLVLDEDVGRADDGVIDGVTVEVVLTSVRSPESLGGMADEKMPLKRCEFASAE